MTEWTRKDQTAFSLRYGWAKLRLLLEVKEPRLPFFWFEMKYSLANFVNSVRPGTFAPVLFDAADIVSTSAGRFKVRRRSQDAAIVSPAFEHEDIAALMSLINEVVQAGGSVHFLDVGANIGQYAVRVGLKFPERVNIQAFEPIPENLEILRSNLALNGIPESRVHVHALALSDQTGTIEMSYSPTQPGNSSMRGAPAVGMAMTLHRVSTETGDNALAGLGAADLLVVKIDVEGHEPQVLRGLTSTLQRYRRCILCIEDIFERASLTTQLEALGFRFLTKLTPYNSWWELSGRA